MSNTETHVAMNGGPPPVRKLTQEGGNAPSHLLSDL
jgi:hypothetical protein